MSSCKKNRNLMSAYIENDLSSELKSMVDEHLNTCAECREIFSGAQTTITEIRALPAAEPSEWFDAKLQAKIARLKNGEKIITKGFRIPRFILAAGSGVALAFVFSLFMFSDINIMNNQSPVMADKELIDQLEKVGPDKLQTHTSDQIDSNSIEDAQINFEKLKQVNSEQE